MEAELRAALENLIKRSQEEKKPQKQSYPIADFANGEFFLDFGITSLKSPEFPVFLKTDSMNKPQTFQVYFDLK